MKRGLGCLLEGTTLGPWFTTTGPDTVIGPPPPPTPPLFNGPLGTVGTPFTRPLPPPLLPPCLPVLPPRLTPPDCGGTTNGEVMGREEGPRGAEGELKKLDWRMGGRGGLGGSGGSGRLDEMGRGGKGARGGSGLLLRGGGGGGAVSTPSVTESGGLRAKEHWVLQMLSRRTASTPTSAMS